MNLLLYYLLSAICTEKFQVNIFVESLNTCLENLKIITGLEEKDIPKPDFHDVFDGSKIEYQKINYGYQLKLEKCINYYNFYSKLFYHKNKLIGFATKNENEFESLIKKENNFFEMSTGFSEYIIDLVKLSIQYNTPENGIKPLLISDNNTKEYYKFINKALMEGNKNNEDISDIEQKIKTILKKLKH